MNEKYYTPDSSELCIGLEYQIGDFDKDGNDIWKNEKLEFDMGWLEIHENFHTRIRVKLLDAADIVGELSARFVSQENGNLFYYFGDKFQHSIIFNQKSQWCIITKRCDVRKEDYTCFVGTIRNKSELKKVMQMVGVK
jgi:hypothetical protein